MTPFFLRLLFGLCAVLGPLALRAAEPAPKPEERPSPPKGDAAKAPAPAAPAAAKDAANKDGEVLELPKIEVTAARVKELDHEIKKLDKLIAREKKNIKATDLDKALNNAKIANAAALFGGNSSEHLEAVAATRVNYMEMEREILNDMRQPRTLDELAMLEKELDRIRTMQRELDNVRR